MKLGTYLKDNKISFRQFGEMLGCDKSKVSRLVNGLRQPSLNQALEIERITAGNVSPSDFVREGSDAS